MNDGKISKKKVFSHDAAISQHRKDERNEIIRIIRIKKDKIEINKERKEGW